MLCSIRGAVNLCNILKLFDKQADVTLSVSPPLSQLQKAFLLRHTKYNVSTVTNSCEMWEKPV